MQDNGDAVFVSDVDESSKFFKGQSVIEPGWELVSVSDSAKPKTVEEAKGLIAGALAAGPTSTVVLTWARDGIKYGYRGKPKGKLQIALEVQPHACYNWPVWESRCVCISNSKSNNNNKEKKWAK